VELPKKGGGGGEAGTLHTRPQDPLGLHLTRARLAATELTLPAELRAAAAAT
jgi:hypothetical protein